MSNQTNESKTSLDSLITSNYSEAIKNSGTFQFFLVVKIKNLNTGQTREICTTGNFLKGALHREYKLGYDSLSLSQVEILAINKDRYFEFKDTSALNNIGLDIYSTDDLLKFENETNIDSLTQVLKNGKWSMSLRSDKTILLYAHALFNRGFLTGENMCFGGTLYLIDDYYWNIFRN